MTRFTQKIVLFVAMVSFANIVSAHNWPLFSTADIAEDHISLNIKQYTDEHYNYKIDDASPLFSMIQLAINSQIKNREIALHLTPIDEESEENTTNYNIIYNGTNVGQIDITRTELADEENEILTTQIPAEQKRGNLHQASHDATKAFKKLLGKKKY